MDIERSSLYCRFVPETAMRDSERWVIGSVTANRSAARSRGRYRLRTHQRMRNVRATQPPQPIEDILLQLCGEFNVREYWSSRCRFECMSQHGNEPFPLCSMRHGPLGIIRLFKLSQTRLATNEFSHSSALGACIDGSLCTPSCLPSPRSCIARVWCGRSSTPLRSSSPLAMLGICDVGMRYEKFTILIG